jgi:dATP pyrophosphohydrolase
MSQHHRPESVLVVIHTPEYECLLLERVSPSGFWQSVTGTLQWGESPQEAAKREVFEETGLESLGLWNAGIQRSFPILPEWADRYAEDVKENIEHFWYLKIPTACQVTLSPTEHVSYRWEVLEKAVQTVASWTNREALKRLSYDPDG